jgi:chemotaxis response regulator CheB
MDSLAGCADRKIGIGLGRTQDPMRPLRTVTVAITPLLGDIISHVVVERAPIDIVAHLDSRDQLAPRLRTLAPDLVLIGLSRDEGGAIELSLTNALPRVKVIALSHDACHAYFPVPHRHRTRLIDLSPEALIETIRGF